MSQKKELIISEITKGTLTLERINLLNISATEIYNCGIGLSNKLEYENAIKCFEKSLELDPTNRDAILAILYIYIQRKKFPEVFATYDKLISLNDNHQKDNNFILYLLSLVCDYPDKYKKQVIGMKYEDVLLTSIDGKNGQIEIQNQIRIRVFQNKLYMAKTLLRNSVAPNDIEQMELRILDKLISKAHDIETNRIDYFLYLQEQKNYKTISEMLEKIAQKRKLSLQDSLIYFISKNMTWIQEKRKIPKVTVTEASSVKDALKGNNFALALRINNEERRKPGVSKEKDIVTILLIEINKLIKEVYDEHVKKSKEKRQSILRTILITLEKNNIESAIEQIKDYLTLINRSDYINVVNNLLKIDILSGDKNFTSLMDFLTKGTIEVDSYIDKFYENLELNNEDKCNIYLEIVKSLYEIEKDPLINSKIKKMEKDLELMKTAKAHLAKYLDEMYERIIMVEKLPINLRKEIQKVSKEIPSISVFSIGSTEPKTIIIKEKSKNPENIMEEDFITDGITSYQRGNYPNCIDACMEAFIVSESVIPQVPALIGMSYLHLRNIKKAIKYLTIATRINERRKIPGYSFEELLRYLKQDESEALKRKINLLIDKFDNRIGDSNKKDENTPKSRKLVQ